MAAHGILRAGLPNPMLTGAEGADRYCGMDVRAARSSPLVGPVQHLGDGVQHRLARGVAVRLVRQGDVADRGAVALERHVEAFRLNRERAAVVIRLAVNQQDGLVDLVRVIERRHRGVDVRHLPERALLVLESERGQGAVVGAAARQAGAEDVGMRQQVGRHEPAVAVTAHDDAAGVGDAEADRAVDRGLRAGHQLLDVGVIRRLARSDDRHERVVDDRVALRQEQQVRGAADRRVAIGGTGDLAGVCRIRELARIRPEQRRQGPLSRRPAWRRDDRRRQLDAVVAPVGDELFLNALELRRRIRARSAPSGCRP